MTRRSFLNILPGLMAAKAIAGELPPLVSNEYIDPSLWHLLENGPIIPYRPLTMKMLEEEFGDLFYNRIPPTKKIRMWVLGELSDEQKRLLKDAPGVSCCPIYFEGSAATGE